jgi:peroxiredoxin
MRDGELVENFTLPDDQGRPWTLAAHRGRTVLLIFNRHLR